MDRTYLEYKNTLSGPMGNETFSIRYEFSEVGRDHFKVKMESKMGGHTRPDVDIPEGSEQVVDKYFMNDHGETLSFLNAPMWIPSSKRKERAKVQDGWVQEIRKWDRWDGVCVLVGPSFPGRWYYEGETGLFVGMEMSSFGSGWNVVLDDHNVWGL